jgi:hypothetical protein
MCFLGFGSSCRPGRDGMPEHPRPRSTVAHRWHNAALSGDIHQAATRMQTVHGAPPSVLRSAPRWTRRRPEAADRGCLDPPTVAANSEASQKGQPWDVRKRRVTPTEHREVPSESRRSRRSHPRGRRSRRAEIPLLDARRLARAPPTRERHTRCPRRAEPFRRPEGSIWTEKTK